MTSLSEEVNVRDIIAADAEAVAGLYNHYVTQTIIIFWEEALSCSDIYQRAREVQFASLPWLVAEQAGGIVGYVNLCEDVSPLLARQE